MRLRWPYVRRTLGSALKEMGWDDAGLAGLLATVETRYKSVFPPVDEDTLAGGLSNTIAGRICNQFDFGGGGYTVDGACSSSLLSVLTACNALSDGHRRRRGRRRRGPEHRPLRDHRLRQDRRARHRRDARLRPALQRFLAGRRLRHARADAQGRRGSARAAGLRDDRRLGLLVRRPGRHNTARGERAPARDRPGLPAGGIRHRHRRVPGRPRHRHRRRRRDRAACLQRSPPCGQPGRAARPDQHGEGQHRAH